MQTIENVYELVKLLKQLNKITEKGTKWNGQIVLIPVILNELYYLGTDFSMVYKAHLGKGENLRGSFFKEFVPEFWEFKPEIHIEDQVWLFNSCGSGAFIHRYSRSKDKVLIKKIKKAIEDFVEQFNNNKRKFEEDLKKLGKNIPKWKKCTICNSLPDQSYEFWKGGELESGGIGYNETFLEIVGAPTFTDSTSYRHWCIKRCPQCNTCYHWDFDYEYLVNGTEDEITLRRLKNKEVPQWLKKVDEVINSQ